LADPEGRKLPVCERILTIFHIDLQARVISGAVNSAIASFEPLTAIIGPTGGPVAMSMKLKKKQK